MSKSLSYNTRNVAGREAWVVRVRLRLAAVTSVELTPLMVELRVGGGCEL